MGDMTVVAGGGKPKPRNCPHYWRKLNEEAEFMELRCNVCGHTKMLAWGKDQERKAMLLAEVEV